MSAALVDKFHRKLQAVEKTRATSEEAFARGEFLRRDIEAVYEGLFLRCVVSFEDLLENVFFNVLNGNSDRHEWDSKISGNVKTLKDCVLEGKRYLDWLPIQETVKRSRVYLRRGKPFSLFDEDDKSKIAQVVVIRHAIAHASSHAQRSFKSKVIGGTPLARNEKSPAGFLRSIARRGPTTTRFQIYTQALGKAALKLK
ncbi:MAG: hypothetical protein AAFN77_15500 [Planctomycetota bacterium]